MIDYYIKGKIMEITMKKELNTCALCGGNTKDMATLLGVGGK